MAANPNAQLVKLAVSIVGVAALAGVAGQFARGEAPVDPAEPASAQGAVPGRGTDLAYQYAEPRNYYDDDDDDWEHEEHEDHDDWDDDDDDDDDDDERWRTGSLFFANPPAPQGTAQNGKRVRTGRS